MSDYQLGQRGGVETVTLNVLQIPSHTHAAAGTVLANNADGNTNDPDGADFAVAKTPIDRSTIVDTNSYTNAAANVTMAANNVQVTVGNTGGSQSHENRPPFLAINYIIALVGYFPSRN